MSCGNPHATACTEVIASISAYIDGEVTAEEYHVITVHLHECPPCGHEEQAHRAVKGLVIRAIGRTQAPTSLHARVRATFRSIEGQ
jgi:anti-sigma factor (TIGR02949 family)